MLAENKAKDWVRLKPKPPKTNPNKHKKKGAEEAKEDSPRQNPAPNPNPNTTPNPTPDQNPSTVMQSSVGSDSGELRDCHGWVVSKFKCRHTIGAGPGRANDGVACCKFKHDAKSQARDQHVSTARRGIAGRRSPKKRGRSLLWVISSH